VVALIVAFHLAFIGYVVIGGFLALRWRRTIWLHIPAVIWGIAIATERVNCPLTWVERWARARAGMAPLPPDGFIAHRRLGARRRAHLVRAGRGVMGAVFPAVPEEAPTPPRDYQGRRLRRRVLICPPTRSRAVSAK